MCRSEFFSKDLRIAGGLPDVTKKRILVAADLVVEKQEMISLIRASVERGVTFFDTGQLYGPFANDGLQMQSGLNEARPVGSLLARI